MASSTSADEAGPSLALQNDPFAEAAPPGSPTHHRFSNFDAQLFALGPNASHAQARKALEAHLAETDRRMEEAGKLGTALVHQREELTERLKDMEKLQAEEELSPDLRQKLSEIEKDYHDVARESARAFLPKQRIPSNEAAAGSPFVPEGKGGRRSVSPSKFEARATGSPTKLTVPNRKIRNQPANRIHDIEFAAEISTSLITQVRNLQGLLLEKDEELRVVVGERSKLEYEAEGFQQRLKALDESEHRYKDENWNLETQIHELMAKEREAADREKKLNQTLHLIQAEKSAAQRELDEVKLSHSKLTEEHAATVKHHDIELGTAKRTMVMGETERAAMQRKIEDLTGQNQELAKAISVSQRGRKLERQSVFGMSDEDFHTAHDNSTPDESPPPSPVKGTPRHSMLETETLKTSLAHAQRTIQGLRSNVHREKTERMEARRLLQEARDEIERLRSDPVPAGKRARKTDSKEFKKPLRLLGGVRSIRSEIFSEDPNWEDHPDHTQPSQSSTLSSDTSTLQPVADHSDHFDTANETSDAAFETANERGTETDDFHTGAEEFSSDDVDTETDSPSKRHTLRDRRPATMSSISSGLARSSSLHSTASTDDDDDYPFDTDSRSGSALPSLQQKFPLRVSRGAFRRSRQASEEPILQSSPISRINSSQMGTPQQPIQSLAAELGDFDGSDNESSLSATPSRRSLRGRTASPPPAVPPLPRPAMVDSGMVTEPMSEFAPPSPTTVADRRASMYTEANRLSIASSVDMEENLAKFPSPPMTSPRRDSVLPPELVVSNVHAHVVEPLPEPDTHSAELAALRAEHADQLKQMSIEHTASQAAAVEALRTQHADQLSQSQAEARLAHAQELEALMSRHAEAAQKAASEANEAREREIEALKLAHAEHATKTMAEAHALHGQELNALRATHGEELAKKESNSNTAHARELDDLRASHSAQLAQKESDAKVTFAAELAALEAAHAEKLLQRESEIMSANSADTDTLKAAHAEQMARAASESKAAFAADLESLKAMHADEISRSKRESDNVHAAEIAALIASHADQIDRSSHELTESHTKALDALKASHAEQIERAQQESSTIHADELEVLKTSHLRQIEDAKDAISAAHSKELETLKVSHNKQLEGLEKENAAARSAEIAALADTHGKQLEKLQKENEAARAAEIAALVASHGTQLEELQKKNESSHAAEIAALVASHVKQLESHKTENEAANSRELAALKDKHAQEIDSLNRQHAAVHAEELEGFKAALAKQVESSKTEGDAAHGQQIEAINAAHAEIIDAHKRDSEKSHSQALESLKSAHEREMGALKSEHTAAMAKESDTITAGHLEELEALRAENEATRINLLEEIASTHAHELEALRKESDAAREKDMAELTAKHDSGLEALKKQQETALALQLGEVDKAHTAELESLRQQSEATKAGELQSLSAEHAKNLDALRAEHEATLTRKMQELSNGHLEELDSVRRENESVKTKELAAVLASHSSELDTLRGDHETSLARKLQELSDNHTEELNNLRRENGATKAEEIASVGASHELALEKLKSEHVAERQRELKELHSTHAAALVSLRTEHETSLERALLDLKTEHAGTLEALRNERDLSQSEALEALGLNHAKQLDQLKGENDAALARELDELKAQHANLLQSHEHERSAEKNRLVASHALELEALRKALTVPRPELGFSPMSAVQTEPVVMPELRSPKRDAFILPWDGQGPRTPFGKKSKSTDAPIIAEDDTRQSPNAATGPGTPESQRPFQEMSTNTDARLRRVPVDMSHQSAQTTLTSEGLDRLMKSQEAAVSWEEPPSPSSVIRIRRASQDSTGSIARARLRMGDSPVSAPGPIPARRPGSSASGRTSFQDMPPLPANHREAIEAARTSSSHGGKGTMGPPLLPASAYRNPAGRPLTPSSKPPLSPTKGSLTPRAGRTPGYADVHSPTKMPARSRQSSMSSFASEIDTRFNIRPDMTMEAAGFGPGTDPRMIQAITQTMIGEYLWKYTRKAGRGEMSENRHRRYFWVHPYTRTLYWSDRDPSTAGRSELKAKSVPIEAVRVVTDDNIMPPGLHRKSLVIISPGRTIKFTCTTGQRHETWFNALSYLLLRTGNETQADTEEMAGNITQDDIDEFNPSLSRRPASGTRARAPPSLSSYNSRTTRNDSPNVDISMSIPTLTPTRERDAVRPTTLGRLSGYFKSSGIGGTFNSMRTRSHTPHDGAIYEASEVAVHDSAEDLRQIIEQQDRESDRLENVRACCDGKHDVGTLSHTAKRGRLASMHTNHSHTHPGQSTTPTPMSSVRSRG
ncbi:hypothetical protein GGR56DRAFT_466127 [Xylariaceae sp. FL0804]|nr:hypothetical protein GGR56DRAFT_466127 [Xylariaceae sp. FL0804]